MGIMSNTPRAIITLLAFLILTSAPLAAQSWSFVGRPEGGEVTAMLRLDPDQMLALTAHDGIFRTTDGGASWSRFARELGNAWAMFGGGSSPLYISSADSLFRSTDGGTSWRVIGTGRSATIAGDGSFLSATSFGISRSTNEGQRWEMVYQFDGSSMSFRSATLLLTEDRRIFASVDVDFSALLARSTDNGATWANCAMPSEMGEVLGMASLSPMELFAATRGGVFRSSDNGTTWNSVLTGRAFSSIRSTPGGRLLALDATSINISTDRGATWSRHPIDDPRAAPRDLLVMDETHYLVSTFSDGLFRCDADGRWTASNRGLDAVDVGLLRFLADGSLVTISNHGLFRSTDAGASWTRLKLASVGAAGNVLATTPLAVTPAGTLLCVHVDSTEGISRSTDNGATWTPVASALASQGGSIVGIDVAPDGAIYAGVERRAVYRSTDDGRTWQQFYTLAADELVTGLKVMGDRLIVIDWQRVLISIDRADPSSVRKDEIDNNFVKQIIRAPDGALYLHEMHGGVLRSDDDGETWADLGPDYHRSNHIDLAVDSAGRVYASIYDLGILRSTDRGATWDTLNAGMPFDTTIAFNGQLLFLTCDPSGRMYAGTPEGLFRLGDAPLAVPAAIAGLATSERATLLPNPTAGHATLLLRGAQEGTVTVSVRDLLGNAALPRATARVDAMHPEVSLDLSGLASGSYFCTVEGGGRVDAIRVVVSR